MVFTSSQTTPYRTYRYSEYCLKKEDIIPPSSLAGKTQGKDYILLSHHTTPEAFKKILVEGLKSLARVAQDPDATDKTRSWASCRASAESFGNDPNLVYFRPLLSGKVHSCSIVIAVRPDRVTVLDQETRVDARRPSGELASWNVGQNIYLNTSLSFATYEDRLSKLSADHVLNSRGHPISCSSLIIRRLGNRTRPHTRQYIPEVPILTDIIEPDLFVPLDFIDDIVKPTSS